MYIRAALCVGLALAGCDKKKSAEPKEQEAPPPSTDWKAATADLDEGDFAALCELRAEAETAKATDAVAALDGLGDKWKAASLEQMHAHTKAAGTHPQIVAILDGLYAHTVCGDRTLSIAAKLTLDVTIPRAGGKDIKGKIDEVAKTTVFSPKGFATLFTDLAGPWVKVEGGEGGPISLMASIGADGQFDVAGTAVPQLTAKSSVFVNGEKVVALDPLAAQGGSIKYTKRTNTETGMSNTDDAIYQATEHMVVDIGSQTAAAIMQKLGLAVPPDPALEALDGSWELSGEPTETNTCAARPDSSKYSTFTTSVSVDARARTLDSLAAKIVDAKMLTTQRQDGACGSHRDKLEVTFVAGKKTMTWTIYDAACKPCTFTVEQPVAKHR